MPLQTAGTAPEPRLRQPQRQIVKIAKALRANAKIIAMDEPASPLNAKEFERLVQMIQTLTAQGV